MHLAASVQPWHSIAASPCFRQEQAQKAQPRHSLLPASAAKLSFAACCQACTRVAGAGRRKKDKIRQPDCCFPRAQISHPRVSLSVIWLCINQSANEPLQAASGQLGSTPSCCPFKVHHKSPPPSHLRPTWARPGDAVASASRACSSLPPAVPPCLRAHPFYCPPAPPVLPNRIRLHA